MHLFVRFEHWIKTVTLAPLHNSKREVWVHHDGPTETQKVITKALTHDLEALARCSSQTSDPRDQVYSRLSSAFGFMFLKIKPDYNLTTVQVFIATTIAILQESRSWAHEQFFAPSESPFMPSWAIDFTIARTENSLVGSPFSRFGAEFKADQMASFRLQESQPGIVSTAGFIHDYVVIAAPPGSSINDTYLRAWPHILVAEETRRYITRNPAYSTPEKLITAYYRTLCMGVVEEAKFVRNILPSL
jgi:hypothetical protein